MKTLLINSKMTRAKRHMRRVHHRGVTNYKKGGKERGRGRKGKGRERKEKKGGKRKERGRK